MSRILLAMDDVELALDVLGALERNKHSVEHVFDLAEALLRASITRPDALVADLAAPRVDHALLRRWVADDDVPLVLVSGSAAGERIARRIGAVPARRPGSGPRSPRASVPDYDAMLAVLVDVVETAIANAAARRYAGDRQRRARSGVVAAAPVVLVAARGANAREVLASFVKSELGLGCVTAASASDALVALAGRVHMVLLEPEIAAEAEGTAVLRALRDQELPVIQLRLGPGDDATTAGRAAWDALPALRDVVRKRTAARSG